MRTFLNSGLVQRRLSWLGVIAASTFLVYATANARAADLGGACCADLEERIAELEATAAHKGNHKVTVEITGQISKALVYYDLGPVDDWSIGENSNAPSYLQIGGAARIGPAATVGFVVQIGIGQYQSDIIGQAGLGYGHVDGGTNGIYTRKAFAYIKGSAGQVAVGQLSQATDGVMDANTSKAGLVSTPLSLRPLVGPGIGEVLDIFDGTRTEAIRYDSPVWAGFALSASAAAGTFDSNGNTDGTVWDVALRYYKEFGEFKVSAAAGYRDGVVIPTDNIVGLVNVGALLGNVRVVSGSASVMHMPTGLFITGAGGRVNYSDWMAGASDIDGWQVQGGIEEKWSSIGRTTLFAEHGQWKTGVGPNPTYWGGGFVQSIDSAAMELYAGGRRYEMDNLFSLGQMTVITAGARVKF